MSSTSGLNIAIVGATGAVGKQMIQILESRKFPIADVAAFSSPRSLGKKVRISGREYVRVLEKGCFQGIQIAFFDASDAISKEWAPQAAADGAWVVDNSATFRMDDRALLCVPEVNGDQLEAELLKNTPQRLIAGPNCSTVQMVMALKPIRDRFGMKRVVVSTYQSTSGAGAAAMEELSTQTASHLRGEAITPQAFAHQIAFNCIPHIGAFKDDGYTSEEQKLMAETKKILNLPKLRISATAIRVPTFSCHAESINVECEKPFHLNDIRAALRDQKGVILQDDPENKIYPMGMPGASSSVEGATGRDAVYVGRLRHDPSVENGLNLWVVSDNLRKGAALNAVQIGEILARHLQK
jgi:aspartate-semialdehyde dehydrogenase